MRIHGYSNALYMTSLEVADQDDNAITLTPGFSSNANRYVASVESSVTQITITATASDLAATFEYLDWDEFTYASTDYAVTAVRLHSDGEIRFWLDATFTAPTKTLVLHAGSQAFAFEVAIQQALRSRVWYGTNLSWAVNETVELSLRQSSNNAATGEPEITGVAQVAETLVATKGDIAGADGTTKADAGTSGYAHTYQWVCVDGTAETDISGATGQTYSLAAADEGKTIKVKVSCTDDIDNSESRTSNAFPRTGSIAGTNGAVLVNNLNETASASVLAVDGTTGLKGAQKFTVGPDSDYIVQDVTIDVSTLNAGGGISLAIHDASGANPSAKIYDLNRPPHSGSGNRTFNAPAGVRLAATPHTSS